jgi:hypothetical protein
MAIRDDVLKTIETIASLAHDSSADENTVVERLVAQGYDVLRAELLTAFVPLGLARPVIARLANDPPVRLSETAVISDFIGARRLTVRLAAVPEFEIARGLGEETFRTGIIPQEQFGVVINGSVELILINKALDEGKCISDAEMASPHLLRLAETPGFKEWYQAINASE